MIEAKLLFLVIYIGFTGWCSRRLLFWPNQNSFPSDENPIRSYFTIFLAGFGITSVLLFLLAMLGCFSLKNFIGITLGFIVLTLFISRFKQFTLDKMKPISFLLFCLAFGLITLMLARIARPYEAVFFGDDASLYTGMSFQLARTGSLAYQDPLVLEMNRDERELIFSNRVAGDRTGERVRFLGGVKLIEPANGQIVFSFYHLFPAWLALGIQWLGPHAFLTLLSLFLALSLSAIYFLGDYLCGPFVGLSVAGILFLFLPELYYSRLPTSELLSQALFLGGALVFISGEWNPSHSIPSQRLIGILWGALFLCRLESLFMLSVSLVVMFACIPDLANHLQKWRTLILYLLLFCLLAIFYQIRRAEYLYIFTSSSFLDRHALVFLAIEWVTQIFKFVRNDEVWSTLFFLACCTFIVFMIRRWNPAKQTSRGFWLKAILGVGFATLLLAPMLNRLGRSDLIFRSVQWMALYFTPWILVLLLVGATLFVVTAFRRKDPPLFCLLIWLLLPGIAYLSRPMVIFEQLWAIRRLVTMVIPLFFLVSLSGWYYFLGEWLASFRIIRGISYLALVLAIAVVFFGQSFFLFKEPLYENVIVQIEELSAVIPKEALVVIPERMAGVHLQAALAFMMRHDVLVLPLDYTLNRKLMETISGYLDRQMKRRPVFIVLNNDEDPPAFLQRHFALKSILTGSLECFIVARSSAIEASNELEKTVFRYSVSTLRESVDLAAPSEIRYDNPEIGYQGFHRAENGYRWTTGNGVIQSFVLNPHGKNVVITLSTLFSDPNDHSGEDKIKLMINGSVPATFQKREGGEFVFLVPGGSVSRITSVQIISRSFVPLEMGLNSDSRTLGVAFVKLSFRSE